MPSNHSAVPPQEVTGTTQLPLSRIKKIIGTDQDINMCSNNAAFVITLATEMFIQYMAESGHNVVKSERKPRRNIQYRDLSSAVSHIDNLEFLSDMVPKTVPLKLVKANAHMANNLAKAKSTVPATNPPFPQSSTSHAGPSATTPNPNSFPQSPLLDTAPPRVSVSGLLEDSASGPASASTSTPALNQIQPHPQAQPQAQPPSQSQPQTQNNSPIVTTPAHPITIPNGFTPTNGFTPANKLQKQQEQRRVSTATEDEDPNAQLRMESQANSDDHDEEEDDDVEMS
ncbi:uncharacterized protein EAF01_006335 [Botrytis porri]|uniref:Transcription factor CBF/NF-Y/archaeal histone domain-containing protein n=1 Tax=Botrytis porri TaxID=87229 RepID=A0A4Z1L307_9HELO|nr:uncharacterized protein EAF01_006335 [Botrytis porri]KAF7903286.1 hypothetical protein EAF01_006335 [Botrytis porri]TGO91222.1 hypothetical protein BPOR_0035g00230 [Botrytis porri]